MGKYLIAVGERSLLLQNRLGMTLESTSDSDLIIVIIVAMKHLDSSPSAGQHMISGFGDVVSMFRCVERVQSSLAKGIDRWEEKL